MISFTKTKEIRKIILPFLFFFVLFMIFYTKFYPLYIYDTDDWLYTSCFRTALPVLGAWNPTRILPETIMPIVSRLSSYFIMPFNGGDLIQSWADGYAIFFSVMISIYFCMFLKFFQRKFNVRFCYSVGITLLMFILHFCIFRLDINSCNGQHLFMPPNVCCMFFYILPFILATTFVAMVATYDSVKKCSSKTPLKTGLVVLFAYLVINSNMFQSIVLSAFVSAELLMEFIPFVSWRRQNKLSLIGGAKEFCMKNYFNLILLGVWLVSLVFEASGGRAGGYHNFDIGQSAIWFWESLMLLRGRNLLLCFSSILLGAVVFVVRKKKEALPIIGSVFKKSAEGLSREDADGYFVRISIKLLLALCFTVIYLVLLCARVGGYILRPDVICSWMIWIIWLASVSWAYVANKKNVVAILLPLVIYIVSFDTVMSPMKFRYINISGYSPMLVKAIDQNILDQVTEADKAGKKYVEVHVPNYPDAASKDNWPLALYGGDHISNVAFMHGLTRERLAVKFVADQAINDKFNLK